MPIRLSCTNCMKPLKVKDDLAGKKIACPGCKTVVRVPAAPVGAAAATDGEKKFGTDELEALAIQAIAEQIAAEAPPEVKYLDFTCPQCDEAVKVDVELAGKQAPCPACKRIVKIPQVKKTGPVDWRGTTKVPGPTKELLKNQEVLDDSWSSSAASKVSSDALLKAGAIKIPRKKVTPLEWAQRGAIAFTVLLVVGAVYWFGSRLLRGNTEATLQSSVESFVSGSKASVLPAESQSDLQRLLGEYYLLAARKPGAPDRDGRKLLAAARQQVKNMTDPVERYRATGELIGSLSRAWPDPRGLPLELGDTLLAAPAGAPRWKLFRLWARQRLAELGENAAAQDKFFDEAQAVLLRSMPAIPGANPAERDCSDEVGAWAVLGQEFMRAKRRDLADKCRLLADGKAKLLKSEPMPLLVLRSMLEQPLPKDTASLTEDTAKALGAALRGRKAEMNERLEKLKSAAAPAEADARLEIAEHFAADDKDTAERQLATIERIIKERDYAETAWLRWELSRMALLIDGPPAGERYAAQLLKEPQLSRFRAKILEAKATATPGSVTQATAGEIQPAGSASSLAHFLVARHLAGRDADATATWAGSLPREMDVPFAELGVLYALLEKK